MTRNYRWNIQRKFHGEWIFHDIYRDTRGIKWRNAKCNRNARDLIAKRLPFSILKKKKKKKKNGCENGKSRLLRERRKSWFAGSSESDVNVLRNRNVGRKGGGSEMAATWRIKRAFWWRKLVVGSALDATSAREWRKKRLKRKQG